MKLKQRPEDFQVEELTDTAPAAEGNFALYRLEKRGWSTPDALAAVRRRWRVEPRRLSYGGMKDRHALTTQYLTIFHGPRRNLHHQGVTVTYLGQAAEAYTSAQVRANRFRVTLRDLTAEAAAHAEGALEEVRAEGVPNYFDDQRFGSVAPGGAFIARELVRGRFEEALRLALAAPYEHDRAAQKQEKATLRACWGDWAACKERLPRGHARSLVDYLLHHPGDFRGAVARLRPELRGLYLSAYQSHLWNRALGRWLEQHCRPEQLFPVSLRLGEFPMYRGLDEGQRAALAELSLPLPSARLHLEADDPRLPLLQEVLAGEGLELRQLQVKGIRELFFSKGERRAVCVLQALEHQLVPDELNAKRQALVLAFDLPRGCYATLIVKRITQYQPGVPATGLD
ncbi:MAG TPA: tRNA pseudouridine(13) synthase TruD [Gemmataceae bacterium]|nr:tRNA pseudouridine(13) synthase TruD [Gemmataceae bacterium]